MAHFGFASIVPGGIRVVVPAIEPPDERAQSLLRIIAQEIDSGKIQEGRAETFLSYSEALRLMGDDSPAHRPGPRLQYQGLAALNKWTFANPKLPKVGALIVDNRRHRPSLGFLHFHGHEADADGLAWWLGEANRAIRFDWSSYAPLVRDPRKYQRSPEVSLRTQEERKPGTFHDRIVVSPAPAHTRDSWVPVADILRWLADGLTESDILRQHRELQRDDIRASLAYAAERESLAAQPGFTAKWVGHFTLPKPDPTDSRLTYLLARYEKNRQ